MKRLLTFAIICLLLLPTAYADPPDFSDWTYDQLVVLQHYITAEIMSRPEWKEVTIPAGSWIVGVDIPAGEYSIYPSGNGAYLHIYNEKGSIVVSNGIRDEDDIIGKIRLKEAYTVSLDGGALIFKPAIALGF